MKGKPRGEVIGILRGNFAAAQIAKRLKVIAVSTNKSTAPVLLAGSELKRFCLVAKSSACSVEARKVNNPLSAMKKLMDFVWMACDSSAIEKVSA